MRIAGLNTFSSLATTGHGDSRQQAQAAAAPVLHQVTACPTLCPLRVEPSVALPLTWMDRPCWRVNTTPCCPPPWQNSGDAVPCTDCLTTPCAQGRGACCRRGGKAQTRTRSAAEGARRSPRHPSADPLRSGLHRARLIRCGGVHHVAPCHVVLLLLATVAEPCSTVNKSDSQQYPQQDKIAFRTGAP